METATPDHFYPEALSPMQHAKPDFDWWLFSTCPFRVGDTATDLHSWLDAEGTRDGVLSRVNQEVSDEAATNSSS